MQSERIHIPMIRHNHTLKPFEIGFPCKIVISRERLSIFTIAPIETFVLGRMYALNVSSK